MAVPEFQSFLRPLLLLVSDGREYRLRDLRDPIAESLKLTPTDRSELLPSGRHHRYENRMAWARKYLQWAQLVQTTRRGLFAITDRGRQVLESAPAKIDRDYLLQFPEFALAQGVGSPATVCDETGIEADSADIRSPEESVEAAHLRLRSGLAAELMEKIKAMPPSFFEQLVVDLLIKMGYGGSRREAGQVVGRSGDEGIDGIISEDRLGLDVVYLQAKKWDSTVGRPEIQKFVGALHGRRAKKGVFMTTGTFSSEAQSYVEHIEPRVVLIDGRRLAELMIDFELGVATVRTYHVKRIDSDYFEDE